MYYDHVPQFNVLFKNDTFLPNDIFMTNDIFNITSIAYALSYLGYLYTEKTDCNNTFFGETLGVLGINKIEYKEYLKDKVIITELGILRAWKLMFENLNNDNRPLLSFEYSFNFLYRLIIKEQERCINAFNNPYSALMTGALLNYLDNPHFEFFRTYYFFIKEKDYFENFLKEYNFGEIYEKFYQQYDISIKEYIEALYIISQCDFEYNFNGIKETKDLSKYSMLMSSDQINDQNSKEKVEKVLQILSFDFTEGKEWSIKTKDKDLDFSLFQEKPLYKLDNNIYAPITRKYIDDQIFNSLIYKIRQLYPKEYNKFWVILGKMFEKYVNYIVSETCKNIKHKFKIIPEFKYGSRKAEKDSSDLYIIDHNNVCVIELKSARPLNSIYQYNNENELETSIEKVIKIPIKQAIKRMNEIVVANKNSELSLDKNYYFLAITLKNFPTHFTNYSEFIPIINNSKIKIKKINNLSIEEFELLCGAIERENHDIFHFLDEYSEKMPSHYSFKNYINSYVKGYPKKFFEELEADVNKFIDKINL